MKHSLVLIESPNKINTISKYLKGDNFKVMATIGHIRELNEKKYGGFGFKEGTYEMEWRKNSQRVYKGRTFDVIDEINKYANESDDIFLSTDPDREGEAISWHIYSILNEKNKKKCKRIVFNEITQEAINIAFKNPRDLDFNQINSYLARKLLDRGLGFKLSDFSQKFIGGMSAGRVQSIALKFLKDKHEEIKKFVPDHWFNVFVQLENGLEITLKKTSKDIQAEFKDLKNGLVNFVHEQEAKKFLSSLSDKFTLVNIGEAKKEKSYAPMPLKTSTMQRMAINKYGMSSKNVDRIAQQLYEGMEIDGEFISLITYPRTDREDLSETFKLEALKWLSDNFQNQYISSSIGKIKKNPPKQLLVQGAHEAIRPTYVHITPHHLKGKINNQELNIYTLIWINALSSLMSPAQYENVLYSFENNKNLFVANNRIEIFDGFKSLVRKYKDSGDAEEHEHAFPPLKLNDQYSKKVQTVKRIDKQPPAPYTESSLIKALEDKGIGRPSTYSHIVDIVLKREYAIKDKSKLLITSLGMKMSEELEKFFPAIMEYDYTKQMEQALDDISENKSNWKTFLDQVFEKFNADLKNAKDKASNIVVGVCPECKGFLKNKFSRKTSSMFVGCDNFPNCKYILPNVSSNSTPKFTGEKCPECGEELVSRNNKKGRTFVGCSGYPKCSYIKRENPKTSVLDRCCPECGKDLVQKISKWKKPFISCSGYPDCKYIENIKVNNSDEQG